jgi:hypothetical protein
MFFLLNFQTLPPASDYHIFFKHTFTLRHTVTHNKSFSTQTGTRTSRVLPRHNLVRTPGLLGYDTVTGQSVPGLSNEHGALGFNYQSTGEAASYPTKNRVFKHFLSCFLSILV